MRADLWAAVLLLSLPTAIQQRGVVRSVSVADPSVRVGGPVEITVAGRNPCGAVRIDYGDGTERVTHPLTELPAVIRYVYKQPGNYQIAAEGMGNCDGEVLTGIRVLPRRDEQTQAANPRLLEMDRNDDRVVTRSEFRGSARLFRSYDWNNDGVISGEELRQGQGEEQELVGTSGAELIVNPTVRWTDTGVYVSEGELVRLTSSGTVQLSGDSADSGGPGGAQSRRRAPSSPMPPRPAGALIARVGDSAPVFVGNAESFRAPASGQLQLGVNDDYLEDNRGQFRVRIDAGRRDR
jgi:hypothetical protein